MSWTSVIYIGTGRSSHEGQYQGIMDWRSRWWIDLDEVLGEISADSNHEVTDIELDAIMIVGLEQEQIHW